MSQWDNGGRILNLLSESPFFAWDSRDQFSIDEAKKVINTLVDRDPSTFVAKAYVSYLIEEALAHSKVTLRSVLLDPAFVAYGKEIMDEKLRLDEESCPAQAEFFDRVATGMDRFGIALTLTRHEKIRLLRDAVCLADLPVTWLHANGAPYTGPMRMNEVIYRYNDWLSLELAIRNGSIRDGLHFVLVGNLANTGNNHAFVFVSPTHTCWFAKSTWEFYESELTTDNRYDRGYTGTPITQVNPHFPISAASNGLVVNSDGLRTEFGKLSSLAQTEAMWILMLMELLALRLPNLTPDALSVSSRLLLESPEANGLLPVLWKPPFELSHHNFEEALEAVGVNNSQMASRIRKLLDGLQIEHLLPDLDRLGLNVDTFDQAPEYTVELNSSASRFGRRVKIPYGARNNLLNLYPRPDRFVGPEGATRATFNMVIERNLAEIINRKLYLDWKDNNDEIRAFMKKMCEKRAQSMFPIWSSEFTEIVSTRPNLYNCTSIMTGGIVEAIQPLVMKGRTDCDPFMRYSISDLTTVDGGMFGGGSRPFGRYGYLTDSKTPDPYLLLPADREEVKILFKCRDSSLPAYLLDYVRCQSHDKIIYPWNMGRGSVFPVGVVFFY
ncbi:hypothetical protein ACV1C5_09535 [Aeromonas caviae]